MPPKQRNSYTQPTARKGVDSIFEGFGDLLVGRDASSGDDMKRSATNDDKEHSEPSRKKDSAPKNMHRDASRGGGLGFGRGRGRGGGKGHWIREENICEKSLPRASVSAITSATGHGNDSCSFAPDREAFPSCSGVEVFRVLLRHSSHCPCPTTSEDEALSALRALPEFTRHVNTVKEPTLEGGDRRMNATLALAKDISTICKCIRQSIHVKPLGSPATSKGAMKGSEGSCAIENTSRSIRTEVLELAWNRLRRVRQILATLSSGSHSHRCDTNTGSSPQRGGNKDICEGSSNNGDVLSDFFSSLVINSEGSTVKGISQTCNQYVHDGTFDHIYDNVVMAASALSVCIAVVLQDWEGLVSAIAPLSREVLGRSNRGLDHKGDESFETNVSSSCGLYGDLLVDASQLLGGSDIGSLSQSSAEGERALKEVTWVSDRELLSGVKTIVGAFSFEVSCCEDALLASADTPSESAFEADSQKSLFLLLSEQLSSFLWGDELGAIHTTLVRSSMGTNGCERGERVPSEGAIYFLLMLLQLGASACRWRQYESLGINARMCSSFRPLPLPLLLPSSSDGELSKPPPSLPSVLNLGKTDLIETSFLPKRFWGVPPELSRLLTLN